ncbi:MBG domain-containing protein, partial [Piscinibacter sakaiensis]|uniref:MBG domain-containing protein n=1 Tax=Piscinibacter sakaiensis TaxID=1547922 RepID=UPI00372C1F9C
SNYVLASPTTTTTAAITPKTLTLAGLAAADKVYDGNTAAVLSGGTLQGLVGSETLGLTVGGRFDTKDVGNDKAVIVDAGVADGTNGGRAANYRLAELAPVRADITPATLVYTADPASKVVGAPLPALSGSVSGFVAGETQAGATTGSLRFTTPATATSPAGAYAVDGGGLSATNYVFTQAPGNATALTVVGLPPQQTDPGARVAVAGDAAAARLQPGRRPGARRAAGAARCRPGRRRAVRADPGRRVDRGPADDAAGRARPLQEGAVRGLAAPARERSRPGRPAGLPERQGGGQRHLPDHRGPEEAAAGRAGRRA